MASSFFRFLDHTKRRTTVGRTPLDERSARRRDLYLTTQHSQQTDIHALDGNLNRRMAADPRRRPHDHWDLITWWSTENWNIWINNKTYVTVLVYNPNIFWAWRERTALCVGQRADCPCKQRDLRTEKLDVADDHKHSCTSYTAWSV